VPGDGRDGRGRPRLRRSRAEEQVPQTERRGWGWPGPAAASRSGRPPCPGRHGVPTRPGWTAPACPIARAQSRSASAPADRRAWLQGSVRGDRRRRRACSLGDEHRRALAELPGGDQGGGKLRPALSASEPLPVSTSTSSAAIVNPCAAAKASTAWRCASSPSPLRLCRAVLTRKHATARFAAS
jgi:hypothetical protein